MENMGLVDKNDKGFYTMSLDGKLFFPSRNSFYVNKDVGIGLVENIHVLTEKENYGFYSGNTVKTEKFSDDLISDIKDYILSLNNLSDTAYFYRWNCADSGDLLLIINEGTLIVAGKIKGKMQELYRVDSMSDRFERFVTTITFGGSCKFLNDSIIPIISYASAIELKKSDIMDILVRNYSLFTDDDIIVSIYDDKLIRIDTYRSYFYKVASDNIASLASMYGDRIITKDTKIDEMKFKLSEVTDFMLKHHIGWGYVTDSDISKRFIFFSNEEYMLEFFVNSKWNGVDSQVYKDNIERLNEMYEAHNKSLKELGKYISKDNITEFSMLSERNILFNKY